MSKKISDKDKESWQNFISSKAKVKDKDQQSINSEISCPEKFIDLHGYTLEGANIEIENFINSCFKNGVKKINVITGKGNRSKNTQDPYQSRDLSILNFLYQILLKRIKFNEQNIKN